MNELQTDADVQELLDRVLAGDVSWVDAGRRFAHAMSDEYVENDRLIDVIWTIENYAWQRDTVINPENINYPWCKGEWTAEIDAEILTEIRAIMARNNEPDIHRLIGENGQ